MQNNQKINNFQSNNTCSLQDAISPIGELILPAAPWQSGHFLTPVISGLANNHEERWLTLILSDKDIKQTLKWIKSSGISNSKVQVLNHNSDHESFSLTQQALASGTSHTVISWINQLGKSDLKKLEQAAKHGKCQGLTVRNRLHNNNVE